MKYIPLLLVPWILSCSYGAYSPTNQNVPLFKQKGEAKLDVSTGYLQGAVAVGKHVALLANVQYASGRLYVRPDMGRTRHRRLELGAGYFGGLKNNPNWITEVYAGVGAGRLDWDRYGYENTANVSQAVDGPSLTSQNQNVFVQSSIGYRGRRTNIALSAKMNGLTYSNLRLTPPVATSLVPGELSTGLIRLTNKVSLWAEPALTVTSGGAHFRLTFQAFYALPLNNDPQQWPTSNTLSSRAYFLRGGFCWSFHAGRTDQNATHHD